MSVDESTSSVSCTHTLMNAALVEDEVGIVGKYVVFVYSVRQLSKYCLQCIIHLCNGFVHCMVLPMLSSKMFGLYQRF